MRLSLGLRRRRRRRRRRHPPLFINGRIVFFPLTVTNRLPAFGITKSSNEWKLIELGSPALMMSKWPTLFSNFVFFFPFLNHYMYSYGWWWAHDKNAFHIIHVICIYSNGKIALTQLDRPIALGRPATLWPTANQSGNPPIMWTMSPLNRTNMLASSMQEPCGQIDSINEVSLRTPPKKLHLHPVYTYSFTAYWLEFHMIIFQWTLPGSACLQVRSWCLKSTGRKADLLWRSGLLYHRVNLFPWPGPHHILY